MYLDRSYRGKGLGHRLMNKIVDEAKRLGYKSIVLDSMSQYKDALRLNNPHQYIYEKDFMYLYKKVISKPIIEIYDWMDIRFSLDRKTIAIEFIESWGNEGENYVALMLRKGWDAPRLVELCAKSDIERYKPFDSSSIQSNEKNPYKGYIKADTIKEIIIDENSKEDSSVQIIVKEQAA